MADPEGFLAAFGSTPLLIDEVQRVPEIYLAIKRVVDRSPLRGQYLLTGSAEPAHVAGALDSLAGRIGVVELRPFSQAELHRRSPRFVEQLFDDGEPQWASTERRGLSAYLDEILAGGYPEPLLLPPDARAGWHDAYLAATFARDVREGSRPDDTGRLARLFRLIASHSGQLLKPASLARDADLAKNTAASWTTALAATRIVDVVPAWMPGERGRVVGTPKGFVLDTGLLAAALGIDRERVLSSPILTGSCAETFAVQEVLRQLGPYGARAPRAYHYRDRDQREVDLVLEHPDGRLVAIEIKASAQVGPSDTRGVAAFQRLTVRRFHRGIVLYCGEHPLPLGDGITAVPMANLWSAGGH